MPITTFDDRRQLLVSAGVAVSLTLALFLWQGSTGLSLWDEGFLWYGVQRTLMGEVPIRDFMAYDPGRYYWSAALMTVLGNDIVSLRIASMAFQALGLTAGLLLIVRSDPRRSLLFLVLSGITLAAWMVPRHKLFDVALSILLVSALAGMIQAPTRRNYFLAGIYLGLIAVLGRNHGVYGAAAGLGAILWLNIGRKDGPSLPEAGFLWGSGIVVGYLPVLIMALVVPGFAQALWESIRFLFEIKGTNLPLPVPWPWQGDFSSIGDLRKAVTGLYFVGLLVFGVLAIAWMFWQRLRGSSSHPALVATALLALPYAHYAFSRADTTHLAQGIFPFLLGCLVLLAMRPAATKWPTALLLCVTSVWVVHKLHSGWQCKHPTNCTIVEVSGKRLTVDKRTAGEVVLLRELAEKYAPNGGNFVVLPFWPGAYALLEAKSPTWEIYALFPRPAQFEQAEIQRLREAKPRFALISDFPLDGRDDLRFSNTHPLTNRFIEDHFERVPAPLFPEYRIYRAQPETP